MLIHALGVLAVSGTGGPVELRGSRQIGLLAILAVRVGRGVPIALIEQELWSGRRVSDAAVRVTANRLRRSIEDVAERACITTTADGYRLELDEDDLDVGRYLQLVRSARRLGDGDRVADALTVYDEAERLWRGRPFTGCDDLPSVRPAQERLLISRHDAHEHRAGLLIGLADHAGALAVLDELISEDRYHERLWALRMCALYGAGRQRDALNAYQEIRRILDAEVGLAPGAMLRSVEAAVLDQVEVDQIKHLVGLRAFPLRAPTAMATTPAATDAFLGRATELELLAGHLLGTSTAGEVAVVEAPAGMGKTRLAAELVATTTGGAGEALWVSCRRGQPELSTVIDLLAVAEEQVGVDHRDTGVHEEERASSPLTPELGQDVDSRRIRLQVSAARQLRALFEARGQMLIVIDDVQWLDAESAAVLSFVQDRLVGPRWLLLTRTVDHPDAGHQFLDAVRDRSCLHLNLAPLPADDVRAIAHHLGAGEHADQVAAQSGGSPLLATELSRLLVAGRSPGSVASGLSTLVATELDRLAAPVRDLVVLLAVAQRPCPLPLLGAVRPDLSSTGLATALARGAEAGLVTVDGARGNIAHDLIAAAVRSRLRPGEGEQAHRDLGVALLGSDEPRGALLALEHLLAAGDLATPAELDAVAASALQGLLVERSLEAVVRLGEGYLRRSGTVTVTRDGLVARVHLAGALIGTGEVRRGEALLEAVEPRLARLTDTTLLADAFMARRLSDMVNSDPVLVDEATRLLEALPDHEPGRRAVLASWVANHLLNLDRSAEASAVLARAQFDALGTTDDNLRATLLWLEYQVAACRTGTPARAQAAFDHIRRFADLSDDQFVETTALICEADHALRFGTVAAYGTLVERLDAATDGIPRADVQWFAAAVGTAHELARGDLVAAQAAIERSSELGSQVPFNGGGGVLVQWVQLWWERGDLGLQRNVLPAEPTPDLGVVVLCGFGLTCLQGGDVTGVAAVAEVLAGLETVVPQSYTRWCFVAAAAAEIADAAGNARLGARLTEVLGPHAGSGLAAAGIVYLGMVEGSVGRALAAMGDVDGAIAALVEAFEEDRRRGARPWAARWADRAATLLVDRAGPGDTATAERLHAERELLLAPNRP